jgi:hypothetical protein
MVSITTSVTKPPGGPGVAQEARGLLHALFDNDTQGLGMAASGTCIPGNENGIRAPVE